MRTNTVFLLLLLLGPTVLVDACADDDPDITVAMTSRPATTIVAATTLTGTDTVRAYFEALTGDPAAARTALALTPAGSDAHAYADWLTRSAEAQGAEQISSEVHFEDDKVSLCEELVSPSCNEYSEFIVNADGKLVTFDVQGNPLSTRLTQPHSAVSTDLATATLDIAYLTAFDQLGVLIELTNMSDVSINVNRDDATYVVPGGQQFLPQGFFTPPGDIAPGARADVVLYFDGAGHGGTLRLDGSSRDSSRQFALEFQIPRP